MKKIYITKAMFTLLIVTGMNVYSQVGIGTTTPDAALDVESNNSGVLVPRVALTSTNTVAPITAGTASELVYNTAAVNDVTPGFYYLNPTATAWVRLSTGPETASKWSLSGNAGTNPTSNFIGTTDSQGLSVRTSGLDRMRVTAAGNVGIGINTPNAKLDVTLTENNPAISIANFSRVGTGSLGFFGLFSGLSLQNYNGLVTAGDKALIFDNDSNVATIANSGLVIGPRNGGSAASGIKIMESGNVGIGSTAPGEKLEVNTGNIFLNSTAGQFIRWANAGSGAPIFGTTRGSGTKLVLSPTLTAGTMDIAIGTDANTLWQAVPQNIASHSFKFYGGISPLVTILGSGNVGIGSITPSDKLEVNTGNIFLNSAVGQHIRWTAAGSALPSINANSVGTKLILSPLLSATTTNFAMGMESNASWQSIPNNTATYSHKFYGGTTPLMTISGNSNVAIGSSSNPIANLELNGSFKLRYQPVVSNNFIVDGIAGWKDLYLNVIGAFNVNLPPLNSSNLGRILYFTTSLSSGPTISAPSGSLIFLNGAAAGVSSIPLTRGLTTLVCDGTNWYAK